jgi:aminopeptidase N
MPTPAFVRVFIIVSLFAALTYADRYPRQPGIDVQHYVFRVTLSDDTDEIQGEATVAVRFVSGGVGEFWLDLASPADAKGMTVTEVSSAGAALGYVHRDNRLQIQLASPPMAGELRELTVRYHGVPAGGLHAIKNKFGERCFVSLNWPTFARQWLPMIDHPSDKATSEFLITAPARYQAVANGRLEEIVDLGDGRRLTHWKQSLPIASWLDNIEVAQFAMRNFAIDLGTPLQTWVFHQDREAGIGTFEAPTRQALEFYSNAVGRYPYEKLADVEAAGMGGGMEHASEIFFGERSVTGRPVSSLVWHEVAHQWFGDSVTEKDWDDAWLSEGFATYFALLSAEHFNGRDAFVAGLKRARTTIFNADKRAPAAVVHDNLPEIENGRAPVAIVYQKGAWVLHMLRAQLGTEKFWATMREYYRRFRDANASTEDLERVAEEVSHADLGWFFRQWLYRAGSPSLDAEWHWDPNAKKVALDLKQTQPGEVYRLPIEVAFAGATRPERIEMNRREQHFEFACEKEPATVDLDPDTWLLADVRVAKL